jgi:hypothetical protein
VNHDVLSCGPLTPLTSLAEWQRLRETYQRTLDYADRPPFSFASQGRPDLVTSAPVLREAAAIVLWVGTGVAEQLLLAWVVQLLRLLQIDPARLRVIQFTQHPASPEFEVYGLGLLDTAALAAHPPAVGVDDETRARLERAWAAVTAPTPDDLAALVAERSQAVPLLERSLASLLLRFPSATRGLSHWDTELLRHTAERGPLAVRVIGHTLGQSLETRDLVGDTYLFGRLRYLADPSRPRPLVTLLGPGQLRGARVDLTDTGRAVLAGTLNAVSANGIDDWVGGTHLDSKQGNVWFHDHGTLVRGG